MSDLINRRDAIKALLDSSVWDCINKNAAVGKCVATIIDLPSADKEIEIIKAKAYAKGIDSAPSIDIPAWIPNEQRLPKYNKRVLICTEEGDIYIGYRSQLLRKGEEPMDCMRDMDGYPIACPDAWMPLPEPYHGGEEQ